ncbi:MAG: dihydroxy-acid dehydratase [Ferrimicrobium sp.]
MELRSAKWFDGDDEVAVLNRVALAAAGHMKHPGDVRPVIGIANSASELNPCNLPLKRLAEAVKDGVTEGGGVPVEFPTISLGEDLMKPTAMLYRNLLSIEVEEMIRSYPLDGVVLLANCDKTVPGSLLGAFSCDIPTVMVTGGARPPALVDGRRIGTGTDLWRLWDQRRAGELSDRKWSDIETSLACGTGACNTMGTASTMAIVTETLGLMVPGSSTIPAGEPRGIAAARKAGELAVSCVVRGARPSTVVTRQAIENAVMVLCAIGGSTNAIIHLTAMSRRLGLGLGLEDFGRICRNVDVLVDVEPCGSGLVQDFEEAGGVLGLMSEMKGVLNLETVGITGRALGSLVHGIERRGPAIHAVDNPVYSGSAFGVLRGTLAPDGAVIKKPSASSQLLKHRGRAIVFTSYSEMLYRIDDPGLDVDEESVLVLAGCGPVGGPGMPEWGMIPIPRKLLERGVRDMLRVSDARMSGTSFGTVVLHVAPEAAVGGPLAIVRDGDYIELDVDGGRIDLAISHAEMSRRFADWSPPSSPFVRGWPNVYQRHVNQAPEGCDLDFLVPTTSHGVDAFVEPEIGRS